jgi:hypothetical protein
MLSAKWHAPGPFPQERGLAANLDFEDLEGCAKLIRLAAGASR